MIGTTLVVTIIRSQRLYAESEDGIRCNILESEQKANAQVGDRWTAEAIEGRVMGQGGQSKVRLIDRISHGFIGEIPDHWVSPEALFDIQTLIEGHCHVMLFGPPGSGKTMLPERLAKARNLGFLRVDCTQILTAKDFFGADTAAAGSTLFMRSEFTTWLERVAEATETITQILCLDEINRVQGKAANALVALLDSRRETTIPTISGPVKICLPKNVGVINTANLGREYSGTYQLDLALANRMVPIKINPAPLEESVRLLRSQPRFGKIPDTMVRELVQASVILREQFEARTTVANPPSFRGLEAALLLKARGVPTERCIQSAWMQRMTQREQDDMWSALTTKIQLPKPVNVLDAGRKKGE